MLNMSSSFVVTFGVENGTICKQLGNGVEIVCTHFADNDSEYIFRYFKETSGKIKIVLYQINA